MRKKKIVDNLDLPARYNHTKFTLIARDPYWIFAYWEISPSALAKLKKKIGIKLFNRSSYIIRMYDVTAVDFNGKNANSSFDVKIALEDNNSYVNLPCDNANYCAKLGIIAPDGKFFPLVMSNYAAVPRINSSLRADLVWMDLKNKKIRPFVASKETGKKNLNIKFEDLSKKAKKIFLTENDIRAYYSKITPLNNKKTKRPAFAPQQISEEKHKKIKENNYLSNNKSLNDFMLNERFEKIFLNSSESIGSSELKGGSSEQGVKGRKFFS